MPAQAIEAYNTCPAVESVTYTPVRPLAKWVIAANSGPYARLVKEWPLPPKLDYSKLEQLQQFLAEHMELTMP